MQCLLISLDSRKAKRWSTFEKYWSRRLGMAAESQPSFWPEMLKRRKNPLHELVLDYYERVGSSFEMLKSLLDSINGWDHSSASYILFFKSLPWVTRAVLWLFRTSITKAVSFRRTARRGSCAGCAKEAAWQKDWLSLSAKKTVDGSWDAKEESKTWHEDNIGKAEWEAFEALRREGCMFFRTKKAVELY